MRPSLTCCFNSSRQPSHDSRTRHSSACSPLLAADIGGTNARFAEIVIDGLSRVRVAEPVIFPTWSEAIDSFDALLERYVEQRPPGNPELEDYDALAIAIAGAVSGRRGTLPNIAWDIDLDAARPLRNAFLLNDFFAQAHAYLDPAVFARLRRVRPGSGTGCGMESGMGSGLDQGSIAIVGAGTGLGHAALKSIRGRRVAIGSESGHCTFAFHGEGQTSGIFTSCREINIFKAYLFNYAGINTPK